MAQQLNNNYDELDNRFNELGNNHDELDNRFNELDNNHDELDNKFNELDNNHDELDNRFNELDNNQTLNVTLSSASRSYSSDRRPVAGLICEIKQSERAIMLRYS